MASSGSGFEITAGDLHQSGSHLQDFGDRIAAGGNRLQDVGSRLVSHASGDHSGIGGVIVKALSRGTEVVGKVFSEGGRVAGAAGHRLHASADNYTANEGHIATSFRGVSDKGKAPTTAHGGSAGGGGKTGPAASHGAGKSVSTAPKLSGKGSTTPSSVSSTAKNSGPGNVAGSIKQINVHPQQNNKPTKSLPSCGDPIDISTGRMLLTQRDVELEGVLPLVFSRTHLSSYRLGGAFGASWASTVDQRLEIEPDGVHFAAEDGMLLTYPTPPDSAVGIGVLPETGPRWPLLRSDDGGYAIACLDSERVLHFGPEAGDRLPISGISSGDGHAIEFERDDTGTVLEIRHSAGYRIGVETADGLIRSLSLVGGTEPDETAQVVLVRYGYDENRRLIEVTNSSGQPLRFEYDADGRIVRWEDRNGMWYGYRYDADGRCVAADGAEGYLSYTFDYTFDDDQDNLVTRATNSLGHTTTFQLDPGLRVVRETDPLGNATESEWDASGLLLSRTDPLGRTTRYECDAAGKPTVVARPDGSQTRTEYNAAGRPVTVVESDGTVWLREYDEQGRLTGVVDPTGARTSHAYDESGRTMVTTDALGRTSSIEHNAAGLPITVTDQSGGVTRYGYDPFGRLDTITDPVGGVTRYVWNAEGQLLARTLPDGASQRWGYDGEGNVRQAVDPQGLVAQTEVAHFDLPVAEVAPDGSRLEFAFDTELRLVAVTNQQGLRWRYDYDPAGNLVRETDFNGRVVGYAYDAAGQLVEQTNAAGQSIRFVRDRLGNVVERHSAGAVTRMAYDPVGRLVRAVTADTDLLIQYDPMGRVVAETVNGRTVASRYDPAGNRVWRRTPSGAESVWQYDPAGRPISLRTGSGLVQFGYDVAGREVLRQVGPNVRVDQTWDANHRLRSQTVLAGGDPRAAGQHRVVQRRGYDYRPDGYLVGVTDQLTGPRRYDLDPIGRVTAVTGTNWAERYVYDPAGNILDGMWPVSEPGPSGQQTRGQRQYAGTLVQRAGAVSYQYDAEGRVVLRQHERTPGTVDTWRYSWDAYDRLTAVVTPDGQRWRYRYDALGRRVAKQGLAPDGVRVVDQVEFTWDGAKLVEQVHNGLQAMVWDWEPSGDRVVSQTERILGPDASQQWIDQRFFAIVTDLVGTPTELVDAAGEVGYQARAALWGATFARPGGAADTPLRFPGQYFDPETGLHYNLHRYYDPATGVYASNDPMGLAPAAHPKNYVVNPTGWIDPLGLAPCQEMQDYASVINDYRKQLGGPAKADKSPRQLNGTIGQAYTQVDVSKLGGLDQNAVRLVVDKSNGYVVGFVRNHPSGDQYHYIPSYHESVSSAVPDASKHPFSSGAKVSYSMESFPQTQISHQGMSQAVHNMAYGSSQDNHISGIKTMAVGVAEGGRFNGVGSSIAGAIGKGETYTVGSHADMIRDWSISSDAYRNDPAANPSNLALLNSNDQPASVPATSGGNRGGGRRR